MDFLAIIDPLLADGYDRIKRYCHDLAATWRDVPFGVEKICRLLYDQLPHRILFTLSRTMVLEMQVSGLQKRLKGISPEARFDHFIQWIKDRQSALKIFIEYPVLARTLMSHLDQWVDASIEMMGRLKKDWNIIKAMFEEKDYFGHIVDIDTGAGDLHRKGRTVTIITFDSGFRLVYKPRSISIDDKFYQLLNWLTGQGYPLDFRLPRMLDQGCYGWMEFVEHRACERPEQINRFYQRLGACLALLYTLRGSDFHWDNLIADGEYPMFVDLETLFSPAFDLMVSEQKQASFNNIHSILDLDILPHRIWGHKENPGGVDISGMAGSTQQITTIPTLVLETGVMDRMRYTRKPAVINQFRHLPELKGHRALSEEYFKDFTGGFESMYDFLAKKRNVLIGNNGPLRELVGSEIRVLFRSTGYYMDLLGEASHPDVMRDALERDLWFDHLWEAAADHDYFVHIVPHEHKDLSTGNIPIFTTRPGSLSLRTGSGATLPDFFPTPPMELVEKRLHGMNGKDKKRLCWLIERSLDPLRKRGGQPLRNISLQKHHPRSSGDRYLNMARLIGDRLAVLSFPGSYENNSWYSWKALGKEAGTMAAMGVDLYDGLCGMILFLAYLNKMTDVESYADIARGAYRTLAAQCREANAFDDLPGAYCGWGGVLYTITHLRQLWGDHVGEGLVRLALKKIRQYLSRGNEPDLLNGLAGAILSLLRYRDAEPRQPVLDLACACGDLLVDTAVPRLQGIGWTRPGDGGPPLAGLSHGSAGIAWALAELAAATENPSYLNAAGQALLYERSLFDREIQNWIDIRVDDNGKIHEAGSGTDTVSWCHGAPGIGLARLSTMKFYQDDHFCTEINAAVQTTRDRGFGHTHCLCHGDMGNLELLLKAAHVMDNKTLEVEMFEQAERSIDSIISRGFRFGVPVTREHPGFMMGMAGIGYQCLRLACPGRIPSILSLDPPIPMEGE